MVAAAASLRGMVALAVALRAEGLLAKTLGKLSGVRVCPAVVKAHANLPAAIDDAVEVIPMEEDVVPSDDGVDAQMGVEDQFDAVVVLLVAIAMGGRMRRRPWLADNDRSWRTVRTVMKMTDAA